MCLIGKTQLLCMQCRGIGPHLVARGKSHGFSRVAAGTWGTFSSYDGDAMKPVYSSMSGSNCCFLTCIQTSQEASQVIWYSHLLKNFSQFVFIYAVKALA